MSWIVQSFAEKKTPSYELDATTRRSEGALLDTVIALAIAFAEH